MSRELSAYSRDVEAPEFADVLFHGDKSRDANFHAIFSREKFY